jgi:hypothetical protein
MIRLHHLDHDLTELLGGGLFGAHHPIGRLL